MDSRPEHKEPQEETPEHFVEALLGHYARDNGLAQREAKGNWVTEKWAQAVRRLLRNHNSVRYGHVYNINLRSDKHSCTVTLGPADLVALCDDD